MSELEIKIETLVSLAYSHGMNDGPSARRERSTTKDVATQIKQTFIADGWIEWPVGGQDPREMLTLLEEGKARFAGESLLTGPQWYAKFSKELSEQTTYGSPRSGTVIRLVDAEAAAKMAAGIDF